MGIKKTTLAKVLPWLVFIVVLFSPLGVFAAPANSNSGVIQLPNPIDIKDPRDLIGRVIGALLGLVGSIALVIFIWGGFLWMTSAGNPERVSKGKNAILWATFGLVVIFSSYILVKNVLTALTPGRLPAGQNVPAAGNPIP